jgi:hypothetical protein
VIEWLRPAAIRGVAVGTALLVVGPFVGAFSANPNVRHYEVAAVPPHLGTHELHTPSSTEAVVETAPITHYAVASTNASAFTSWGSTGI